MLAKLRRKSRRRVWLATAATTLFVILATNLINYLFLPSDLFFETWKLASGVAFGLGGGISFLAGVQFVKIEDLSRKNRFLVNRDCLTRAYTRKRFFERLQEPGMFPGYLAMVDIDHFKSVNDAQGHLFGDEALRHFAAILRSNMRGTDIMARFGGEEFMIYMPHVTQAKAKDLAETLRRHIMDFTLVTSSKPIRLTASFGLTSLTQFDNIDAAIHAADTALYEAKKAGRNRVSVYDPPPKSEQINDESSILNAVKIGNR